MGYAFCYHPLVRVRLALADEALQDRHIDEGKDASKSNKFPAVHTCNGTERLRFILIPKLDCASPET